MTCNFHVLPDQYGVSIRILFHCFGHAICQVHLLRCVFNDWHDNCVVVLQALGIRSPALLNACIVMLIRRLHSVVIIEINSIKAQEVMTGSWLKRSVVTSIVDQYVPLIISWWVILKSFSYNSVTMTACCECVWMQAAAYWGIVNAVLLIHSLICRYEMVTECRSNCNYRQIHKSNTYIAHFVGVEKQRSALWRFIRLNRLG